MEKLYTSVQKVHTVKLNTDVTITILPIQQHKSTLKYHQFLNNILPNHGSTTSTTSTTATTTTMTTTKTSTIVYLYLHIWIHTCITYFRFSHIASECMLDEYLTYQCTISTASMNLH